MADTTTSHIKSQWWLLGSTDRWPQPQQCYLGTPGLDLVTRVMSVWWVGFQRDATSPSESWLTEEFIWPFRALKKRQYFSPVPGGRRMTSKSASSNFTLFMSAYRWLQDKSQEFFFLNWNILKNSYVANMNFACRGFLSLSFGWFFFGTKHLKVLAEFSTLHK